MGQEGFSLLGALIGIAIFVIGMLAIFAMQSTATMSGGKSMKYTQANSWAQDTLEMLVNSPYDDPTMEPPYGAGDQIDPLEQVNCKDNSRPNGIIHERVEGPYTIKWVVFTSEHNGRRINDYSAIRDDPMFERVDKTQILRDIPDDAKLVSIHVSHPLGQATQYAYVKANL